MIAIPFWWWKFTELIAVSLKVMGSRKENTLKGRASKNLLGVGFRTAYILVQVLLYKQHQPFQNEKAIKE